MLCLSKNFFTNKESTISEIVKLVVEATNTKSKIQKLADRISGYFVPIVIIISIFTCGILGLLINLLILLNKEEIKMIVNIIKLKLSIKKNNEN